MATLDTDDQEKLQSVQNALVSAESVKSYRTNDRQDAVKLAMLADILGDILKDGLPSEEDLDNDWDIIEMYAAMDGLKDAMADCGIYPEN